MPTKSPWALRRLTLPFSVFVTRFHEGAEALLTHNGRRYDVVRLLGADRRVLAYIVRNGLADQLATQSGMVINRRQASRVARYLPNVKNLRTTRDMPVYGAVGVVPLRPYGLLRQGWWKVPAGSATFFAVGACRTSLYDLRRLDPVLEHLGRATLMLVQGKDDQPAAVVRIGNPPPGSAELMLLRDRYFKSQKGEMAHIVEDFQWGEKLPHVA